jgi:hypothetical protein
LFKKASVRVKLAIGLKTFQGDKALTLAGCFINVVIHIKTYIHKKKRSKKEK